MSDRGQAFGGGLAAAGGILSLFSLFDVAPGPEFWTPASIILALLGLAVALVFGSSRGQANRIIAGVGDVSAKQDIANQKLDTISAKQDQTNDLLRDMANMLRDIRDDFRRGRP